MGNFGIVAGFLIGTLTIAMPRVYDYQEVIDRVVGYAYQDAIHYQYETLVEFTANTGARLFTVWSEGTFERYVAPSHDEQMRRLTLFLIEVGPPPLYATRFATVTRVMERHLVYRM